ncbi:MAG: SCO family protein [Hyphomicrobiaceae bacterium]|nr:SCO family protein [Hyphomicrobiaceae bacterium]
MHAGTAQSLGRRWRVSRAEFGSCLLLAAWFGVLASAPALAQADGTIGPRLELIDQSGKPFSYAALAGRPYAIFFGFTHCPDVCPTTLMTLSNALQRLGADGDRVRILFVSVDPERDTPEQLREYLAAFDARIIGLTGSEAQIASAAKDWKIFHNKIPEDDGSYTIVHSAYVYLMDRANRLVDTMGFQDSEEEQAAKLRSLIEGSGR